MSSQVNAYPPRQGNSLVELVVVITMVGVIFSFAIPRFTRLENNVRATAVTTLSVTLRSAAAAAHAQYLESGARLSSATLNGRSIQLKNGYPDAGTRRGIGAALADLSGFTVNVTPTSVIYSKTDAPAPAQCTVTYRASAERGEATIGDLKTSGC
jgi:type II secretory pathway pseudopilin PulG